MSEVFDLDAAVGEDAIEPFRFTWGGEQFELPAVISLPIHQQIGLVDAVDSLGKSPSAKQIVEVLDLIVSKDMLARISAARPFSATGLVKLVSAWMGTQGETVGKSPSKSASSGRTAPQLKPTSRSGRARRTS